MANFAKFGAPSGDGALGNCPSFPCQELAMICQVNKRSMWESRSEAGSHPLPQFHVTPTRTSELCGAVMTGERSM